ncbi:hypothetical protein [Sulfurimonas sp.]|uniref:hypothetical protein n=1 Tax=Sulfurimonas sp. TaxID=2022749 RepID=UPI003D0EE4A6
MYNRKCPCCNETFSLRDYLGQVLNFKVKKFNEDEPDKICLKCKSSILSATNNNKYIIALIPLFYFYDLAYEYFFNYEYVAEYIASLFMLLVLSFYVVYLFIPLKCQKSKIS